MDSQGKPVAGVKAHQEWLDPIHDGVTFADSRDTNSLGFVEFPRRVLRNRLALGFSTNGPSAHIFVCWGDEFGDVFFDKHHPQMDSLMRLRKGSCPYG